MLHGGRAVSASSGEVSDVAPSGPRLVAGAATFSATDYAWEQVQESAVRAFRAGGSAVATKHWQRGLTIARAHFDSADPRLATSLTNIGLVLRRRGDLYGSAVHFEEALAVWDRSLRWVRLMAPLEHPEECYAEEAIRSFEALIAQGRAATAALERYDLLPCWGLERWHRERPRRGSDLRKLLGAVFLIASRAG